MARLITKAVTVTVKNDILKMDLDAAVNSIFDEFKADFQISCDQQKIRRVNEITNKLIIDTIISSINSIYQISEAYVEQVSADENVLVKWLVRSLVLEIPYTAGS